MIDRDFGVDLHWIPLGAGGHFVRFNGKLYEAVTALLEHRPRLDVYHSALDVTVPTGHFMVEMTPVPAIRGSARGVVAEGPVGISSLARFRIFRYEVRRWRDGVIPDLPYAVASPVRVTEDVATAIRVLDLIPHVPRLVWGRDELHAGEMWTCNSIISWVLTAAGLETAAVPFPARARAPGWDAGIEAAQCGTAKSSLHSRRGRHGAGRWPRVPAA